jgi:DNA-binding PadR family transcriptional regulator
MRRRQRIFPPAPAFIHRPQKKITSPLDSYINLYIVTAMSLQHILLGMLQKPASGYDLKAQFQDGARHFWSAELSQIYPTLQKMQEKGWLKSRRQKSEKGPDRRVYKRTRAGTAELVRWLRAGPVMGTERFAYIAQLVYAGELADLAATQRFLEKLRERLRDFARLLESAEDELRQSHPDFPDDLSDEDLHGLLALRIGIRSLNAKVAACDEALELLRHRLSKVPTHV